MTDIVERLRQRIKTWRDLDLSIDKKHFDGRYLEEDAADEIARLRAALEPFAKAADGFDKQRIKNPEEWFAYGGVTSSTGTVGAITVGDLRRARAALEGKHD